MKYSLDLTETKYYYDSQTHFCDCAYCRNYRKVLPIRYPQIIELLSGFGLDFDKEFEIIEYGCEPETPDNRLYEGLYAVFGMLFDDNLVIYDNDGVKITLLKKESAGGLVPKTDKAFFMLCLWISLPWELDEEP